jgi:hypothetical protein
VPSTSAAATPTSATTGPPLATTIIGSQGTGDGVRGWRRYEPTKPDCFGGEERPMGLKRRVEKFERGRCPSCAPRPTTWHHEYFLPDGEKLLVPLRPAPRPACTCGRGRCRKASIASSFTPARSKAETPPNGCTRPTSRARRWVTESGPSARDCNTAEHLPATSNSSLRGPVRSAPAWVLMLRMAGRQFAPFCRPFGC